MNEIELICIKIFLFISDRKPLNPLSLLSLFYFKKRNRKKLIDIKRFLFGSGIKVLNLYSCFSILKKMREGRKSGESEKVMNRVNKNMD